MEDTKVEGTKIKKRSRNVKEVPNDRLRMMSRVLFPGRITLKIFRCYSQRKYAKFGNLTGRS